MTGAVLTAEDAWALLRGIPDPEVPVVSIVELGIVREVVVDGSAVRVDVTPTYSGCPAMFAIESEIVETLRRGGFAEVRVRTLYAPVWTTDWIGDEAREKLRRYGIAPPGRVGEGGALVTLRRRRTEVVECPYCGSAETSLRSEFGSTACKSIHFCAACRQPFEKFKEQ